MMFYITALRIANTYHATTDMAIAIQTEISIPVCSTKQMKLYRTAII